MKRLLITAICAILTSNTFAQYNYQNSYDAWLELSAIINEFIRTPTNAEHNEYLYDKLRALHNRLNFAYVEPDDRKAMNIIVNDVNLVENFIAAVKSRSCLLLLKGNDVPRLKYLFGENLTIHLCHTKCNSDTMEFIELKVGSLKICYLHNISPKGFRVKITAFNGNAKFEGTCGASSNEYFPLFDNVNSKYYYIRSVKIIEKF